MKTIRLLLRLLLAAPIIASAGGSYTGKLQPYYYSNTLYLIPIESQILNKPSCATRQYIRLPDAADSPTFNSKFSIILSAWVAQKELVITGTGNCTSEGDEVIRSILVK